MIEIPAAALRAAEPGQPRSTSVASAPTTWRSTPSPPTASSARWPTLQDPWQPALLDLVALRRGGRGRPGKPCGVCGEAAADPAAGLRAGRARGDQLVDGAARAARRTGRAGRAHTRPVPLAAQAARGATTAAHARAAARSHLPGLVGPGALTGREGWGSDRTGRAGAWPIQEGWGSERTGRKAAFVELCGSGSRGMDTFESMFRRTGTAGLLVMALAACAGGGGGPAGAAPATRPEVGASVHGSAELVGGQ